MLRPERKGQEADALGDLPMRFNPPPGWPVPSRDWVMEYLGLPITANRRPVGAPRFEHVGWEWWITQEPHWTAWMAEKRRRYRVTVIFLGVALVACTAIAISAGEHTASLIAIVCAIVAGGGLMVTSVQYAQFRRDPMSPIRERWALDHRW
jgi:hypothetical protein